ncbi:hypothetical protein AMS68_007561 [Peltaster fructicola]|uniref:Ribonucleases P/MRP subunit Pop8-like domain-containing protein n=1 Tax=Peltaster fructicola TaxID=286661 RepID=A0A6H0Y4V1_9PEZI|nr:hypothetical protein AMS68_007561 [Peltaster fructicola]
MAEIAETISGPEDTTLSSLDSKKRRHRTSKNLTIAQFSCRHPEWTYFHLRHISDASTPTAIDETSVSLWIDAALSQFLGLHGRAVPVDFLKLQGQDIHIRIPHDDQQALIAALSNWTGRNGDALRTVGWSSWDANAYAHDAGQDLFND